MVAYFSHRSIVEVTIKLRGRSYRPEPELNVAAESCDKPKTTNISGVVHITDEERAVS